MLCVHSGSYFKVKNSLSCIPVLIFCDFLILLWCLSTIPPWVRKSFQQQQLKDPSLDTSCYEVRNTFWLLLLFCLSHVNNDAKSKKKKKKMQNQITLLNKKIINVLSSNIQVVSSISLSQCMIHSFLYLDLSGANQVAK